MANLVTNKVFDQSSFHWHELFIEQPHVLLGPIATLEEAPQIVKNSSEKVNILRGAELAIFSRLCDLDKVFLYRFIDVIDHFS